MGAKARAYRHAWRCRVPPAFARRADPAFGRGAEALAAISSRRAAVGFRNGTRTPHESTCRRHRHRPRNRRRPRVDARASFPGAGSGTHHHRRRQRAGAPGHRQCPSSVDPHWPGDVPAPRDGSRGPVEAAPAQRTQRARLGRPRWHEHDAQRIGETALSRRRRPGGARRGGPARQTRAPPRALPHRDRHRPTHQYRRCDTPRPGRDEANPAPGDHGRGGPRAGKRHRVCGIQHFRRPRRGSGGCLHRESRSPSSPSTPPARSRLSRDFLRRALGASRRPWALALRALTGIFSRECGPRRLSDARPARGRVRHRSGTVAHRVVSHADRDARRRHPSA